MKFSFNEQERQGVVIVSIQGYFTGDACSALGEVIRARLKEGKLSFILDLSQCPLANSPGIAGTMDLALEVVDGHKGSFLLVGLDEMKRNVFEMIGIFHVVEDFPTLESAIRRASTR